MNSLAIREAESYLWNVTHRGLASCDFDRPSYCSTVRLDCTLMKGAVLIAKKTVTIHHTALTGKFVTAKYAQNHPRTTETERPPKK